MEISEQLSPRFSSGCILCGKLKWRFKIFDIENRQYWICVDCLMKQKILEVKDVRKETGEDEGLENPEPKPDRSKDNKQPAKGDEPAVGNESGIDVEG